MKILFLGEPLSNALQWMKALEKFGDCQVVNWHIKGRSTTNRYLSWLLAAVRLRRLIKKTKPDIVIGYRTTSYGFLAAFCKNKICVIAAQGETDVWPIDHWTAPIKGLLVRYAVAKADLIHAWGPHIAETLKGYGALHKKILILPRGIDLTLFNSSNKTNNAVVEIVTTRSLYPEYCHDLILRALARLKFKGLKFHYTIIGTGTQESYLNELSLELGLQAHVSFKGKVNNDELPGFLRNADIYVAMPLTEGVSASLFEAMACGCFPVVADLKGNRIYIDHGKTGFLVPPNDEDCLERYIAEALTDHALRIKGAVLNRDLVEREANLESNIKTFTQHYRRLINEVN